MKCILIYMQAYMSDMCVTCFITSHRARKRVSDPLELELQRVLSLSTWELGTEFRSPEEEQTGLTVPPLKYI